MSHSTIPQLHLKDFLTKFRWHSDDMKEKYKMHLKVWREKQDM